MAIKLPKMFTGTDAKSRIFVRLCSCCCLLSRYLFCGQLFKRWSVKRSDKSCYRRPPHLRTNWFRRFQMTPEFYQAVVQANTQAARQAQISGGSAVPTIR